MRPQGLQHCAAHQRLLTSVLLHFAAPPQVLPLRSIVLLHITCLFAYHNSRSARSLLFAEEKRTLLSTSWSPNPLPASSSAPSTSAHVHHVHVDIERDPLEMDPSFQEVCTTYNFHLA